MRSRPIFYGWWNVVISSLIHFLTGGLYSLGLAVYFLPISRDLGLSRAKLSLAFTLRSLESEGLVEITPRRGAVVTSLTKRDFLEAYQVREALEALGVRLAVPRLTESGLDSLDDRIERMAEHAASGDVDSFFEANAGFHEAFMEASENRMLIDVYRRLMAQMGPYRRPSARLRGNVERSIAEHSEIVAAARQRDVEAAVALVMRHVEVPQRMLEGMTEEEFARPSSGQARA